MAGMDDAPKQKNEPDKLRARFNSDLQTAVKYMEPIHQRMDADYDVYRNGRDENDQQFRVSDLFAYVETVTPIVTSNRIRANIRSDYPEYVTHAKGINDILDNTYDVNDWDYESQHIMRMALISRSSFAYTGFDKDYKNKTGKLGARKISGRWCYLDPAAVEFEDSSFFFYVEPKRKTEVTKLHPHIKAELNKPKSDRYNLNENGFNKWFKNWVGSVKSYLNFKENNKATQVHPYTITNEMQEDQRFASSIAYIHYWYRDDDDEWRCSYWADEIFCKDESNPFWHGCLPYDIYSPIKDTISCLGIPINEQIKHLQEERNNLIRYSIENSKLHGRPPLMYNTSMGNVKDPEALREQADNKGIIPINNPDMVPLNAIAEYMSVPVMPGYSVQMPEVLQGMEDHITGVNDSFRGTQQATSGKEVQLQQEASYNRIKTMIDQFELFNKKIAQKIIINAMQFYTTTRTFRIKGDYTKYSDVMEQQNQPAGPAMPGQEAQQPPVMVEPIQKGMDPETQQPIMDRTEFYLYANPNEWTKITGGEDPLATDESPEGYDEDGEYKEEPKKKPSKEDDQDEQGKEEAEKAYRILSFVVEIEAGSSLPQSRLARREEAVELAGMGMIDQQAVLDIFDWPDREEVIKRMQEQAKAQQEAQAAAAQAESQAKMQMEQQKMQQQMELEQMKLQSEMQKTQANNDTKLTQQKMSNTAKADGEGGKEQPNLAQMLDQIRQQMPETAQMTDEQLLAALTK